MAGDPVDASGASLSASTAKARGFDYVIRPAPLIALMCLAQVLTLPGFAAFPALLPKFTVLWSLSNTDAGWINGLYFAGHMAAVPLLVTLTDRVDPKRMYLWSLGLAVVAGFGFALFADGFWTAAAFRALAGVALAGTFMPGLKLLVDQVAGRAASRELAFYSASFGVGAAHSMWMTGAADQAWDWRWAFALTGLGPLLAVPLVWLGVGPCPPSLETRPTTALLDFRPVLKCRLAMAYVLAYFAHDWELYAFRSWTVAFLVFAQQKSGAASTLPPTTLAAVIALIGVPSILAGGELMRRFGRRRFLVAVMLSSAALACIIGFASSLSYGVLMALLFVYGVLVIADNPAITAGVVANAPPGYRGMTMAVHSFMGFSAGVVGPLAFGMVLDAAGGTQSVMAWGFAFAILGLGAALGPLSILMLGRGEPGTR
jgi:MFS family permease